MQAPSRARAPAPVWWAAALLGIAGVAAMLLGLLISWVSGVDGSTTPLPALLGAVTATACAVAAAGLVTRRLRRRVVLALGAVPVAACVVASPGSVDIAVLVLPACLGWLLLLALLTRPSARAWLSS
jgi:hypothetical protein